MSDHSIHLTARRGKAIAAALVLSAAVLAGTVAPSVARPGGHHHGNGFHSQRFAGHHPGHWRRGYAGGGYRHYGRGYRRGLGYAGIGVGAGLAALAAGAMIGDAAEAAVDQGGPDDAVAYCSSRFRSYDPSSGTYLGYDGAEHACP